MTNQAGWTKEKCWEDTKCIAGKEQAIPNSKEKLNYICFSVKQKAIDAFKKSSIDTMTDCGTGCKEVKGVKHKCATITITGTENKTYKKEKCQTEAKCKVGEEAIPNSTEKMGYTCFFV